MTKCWTWPRINKQNGYGSIVVGSSHRLVHRLIYEIAKGPIPKGLTIDHLCRNRACVNPDHLEPVTLKVNVLRGESICARKARQKLCSKNLHPLKGSNLISEIDNKGRVHRRCRKCRLAYHWKLSREEDESPMVRYGGRKRKE